MLVLALLLVVGIGHLDALLHQPVLPRLFSGHLDIGRVDTLICGRPDASSTDTKHQAFIDGVAVETWIVALQTLCRDAVRICDTFARVLICALVNELTIVAIAAEAEP